MALKNGKYLKQIEIEIENVSPLNIGTGDGDPLIDEESNQIYFPGTSMAGAIKSYLQNNNFNKIDKMFGGDNENNENALSKVFIYDSFSNLRGIEVRPGVSINGFSGAADNGHKFDRKYVGMGHKFTVNIEIYSDTKEELNEYSDGIYSAIIAINNGNINFGSYKTGGAGVFKINSINERQFNFIDKSDLFMYLKNKKPYKVINIKDLEINDNYNNSYVQYELSGEIETSLLIKGMSALDYNRADDEQIQNINGDYIIPGTSLKGIIRSQGERILKFYRKQQYIEDIFGSSNNDDNKNKKKASRFTAFDVIINNCKKVTYSKIKVDRFTGGIMKGQKMEEEPVTGAVTLKGKLKIENQNDKAIGLVALIFRDIAKGELPIGSGNNIGRGRIKGKLLKISLGNNILFKWNLENNKVDINKMDDYIAALSNEEAK